MPTLMDRASRLRRLIHSVSSGLRWLPPTVARLTVGWIFLQSGLGQAPRPAQGRSPSSAELGIPAPQFQAPLAATAEFVCGALLLVGLFTRVATLPLIATMIVAILTAKKADIHELSDLFGMGEYLYIVLLLWLGAYGAGPISIDALFARRLERRERPVPGRTADRPQDFSAKVAAAAPKGRPFRVQRFRHRSKRPNPPDSARSHRSRPSRASPRARSFSSPRARSSVPAFRFRPRVPSR